MNAESQELTLPERAAVALGTPKYEQELRELVAKSATIADVKNKDGRDQCHGAMMTLKTTRVAIEKAAKVAREDATAFSKAVIAEEKRLVALAEPEEERLQGLRDVWDAEVEREKQAKAAAEKARVGAIRARIDAMRNKPASMVGRPSDEISAVADVLSETVIALTDWQEFSGEAITERDHAVKKLREMQAAQLVVEAEYQRLKAEREEMELQRLQLAAAERKAAAARAEQEAKDRAERERVETEQRDAQAKAAEAMRLEREAHEKLVQEQQAEFARQQAEMAEKQRQLREATEKLAREQREREEAEALARQIEAAHAEAIEENIRIDAERAAAIEAQRIAEAELAEAVRQMEERQAAEAERIRREIAEFTKNGPGDVEIVKTLAAHYDVTIGDVMQWMKKFDYAATDELLAAENVAANRLEKAA